MRGQPDFVSHLFGVDEEKIMQQHLINTIYTMPKSNEAWLELIHQLEIEVEKTNEDIEASTYQHLNRSIQLGLQINELESKLYSHQKTLNMIQTPTVILDALGTIIDMNNAAQNLFNSNLLFQPDKSKILFTQANHQKTFLQLISQTNKQHGRQTLTFNTSQHTNIIMGLSDISQGHDKRYLLMMNGSQIKTSPSSKCISETLYLTSKESEITKMIADGESLQVIANACHNSYETIRTHLKRIFVKTGCKSQIELAYKVYSSCLPDISLETNNIPLLPTEDSSIQLKDGRTLSYCIYGPKDGFPLIMHHTIEGSRKQIPLEVDILFQYGIRVIIPDRPGYGKSTYAESRLLHDWPKDLNELLSHLSIERFSLMGQQFGAEYALVSSQHFTDRVVSTHLVSMSAPPEIVPSATSHFSFTRAATILAHKAPKALRKVIHFASQKYQHRPRDFMKQVMIFQSEKDQHFFSNDAYINHSFSAWLEGSKATQCLMAVKELQIISSPWNIDFKAISSPVHIWHSQNDPQAPYNAVEQLLPYFPTAHRHISTDDSVLTYLHCWQDILKEIHHHI